MTHCEYNLCDGSGTYLEGEFDNQVMRVCLCHSKQECEYIPEEEPGIELCII